MATFRSYKGLIYSNSAIRCQEGYRLVNINRKKLLCVLLVFVIVGSIAASAWMGMPKSSPLIGMAYLDRPIAGATVSVYDLNGNKVFEAQNATNDFGVFIVNVGWAWVWGVPEAFKVTVTGGTIEDTPFTDTIVRYIQKYDQTNNYAINPITTLIAACKDDNPAQSFASIESSITSFLDIPTLTTLDSVINNAHYNGVFFDATVFSEEAQANGGLNTFVEGLVGEIEQGKTHPFKGESLVAGEGGGAFSWTVGALGEGALCYFEEMAIGWVMSKLGYKSPEEKQNEKIMKELEAMSAELDQINEKLDIVIADLAKISAQLAAIQNALKNMEIELEKYIGEVNSYDPLAKIDNAYSDLVIYSKCAPGDVSNDTIHEWAAAVLDPTSGIGYAIDLLDKFNTGNVLENEEGLMQILTDQMNEQVYQQATYRFGRAYRDNVYSAYQSLTDYFQKVLYYEVKGLTLISEAHHPRNETLPVKYYIENTWKPKIANQIQLYTSLVEKIVVALGDTLEFPNMGPFPANTPSGYFKIYENNYGHRPPSIAEIFPEADYFADQLLNGTGKFVVRVLYDALTYPNLTPADPKPVFQNIDTGKQYHVAGVLHSVPVIDRAHLVRYYYTYDFGALPAGRYKLASPSVISTTTDIKGWSNTPPLEQMEYWSFREGIQTSLSGLLTESGSYLPHVGAIQVVNNQNNHAYGYWGGTWYDKSIDHGFR